MENYMETGYHLSENRGKKPPLYRGKHENLQCFGLCAQGVKSPFENV